jgi:molybdate transport system permease protein
VNRSLADPDRRPGPPGPIVAVGVVAAALLSLPLVALLVEAPWSSALEQLRSPAAGQALRLSLVTSLLAVVVAFVLGVPLAWVQARVEYPGRSVVRAVTTLPLVLPPVVGGIALLLAFGQRGLAGGALAAADVQLPFTTAGAVAAEAFVALPFLTLTVEGGLRQVDRRLEDAARTLGASRWDVFRTVTLPLVRPSLTAGAVLAWARALGEFGATITFAGNLPGTTQTLPLFVYVTLNGSDPDGAIILSLVLLGVSVVVLAALRDRWLRAL